MKRRILKILALSLILVMVLSLTIVTVAPVSAEENEWSEFTYFKEGADGDWFYSNDIDNGPGPITRAIDGTLYCYAMVGIEMDSHVFKSIDEGRTWSKTDYYEDLSSELGENPGAVVDFAPSSLDADILYATHDDHVYWTEDGGDKWKTVADTSLQGQLGQDSITSIDVAYDAEDNAYVFIGTTVGYVGTVFYVSQGGYPSQWTDLEVEYNSDQYDVYAVAASPEFADTDEIFAVCSDNGVTVVLRNLHGTIGDWEQVAELRRENDDSFTTKQASRIKFPDDFDEDHYEFFVGVCFEAGYDGSVFRVNEDNAYNLGKDDSDIVTDVVSLDVVGSYGATSLIAGTQSAIDNKVLVSTDDGDNWDDASKEPSGSGDTWVVFAPDFADNGTAFVACDGTEGAVSLTVDGGDMYNQISLISTGINSVDDFSFSPNYATDGIMFLLTTKNSSIINSLWRYDGKYWERVFVSTLSTPDLGPIDRVQVSPNFPKDETVYVARSSPDNGIPGAKLYRSTDSGNDWDALSNNPPDNLTAWIVIDEDTVITGTEQGNGVVWKTESHGRRAWEDYDLDHIQGIWSFAMSPAFANDDTLLLADDETNIYISENIGEDWDQIGDRLPPDSQTYVAFDPGYTTNNTVYAASHDAVYRCVIDISEDWEDQEWKEFTTAKTGLDIEDVHGLVVSDDGTLYVADETPAGVTTGGAWRCLNPTDDIDDVIFEIVSTDFELGANAQLENLHLTAGSNVLWSTDGFTDTYLWTYEDTLATQVVLDEPWSNTGLDDIDEVTLKWEELTGADYYELKYTDDPEWKENVETIDSGDDLDETFKWIEGLDDGTKYHWKVRVDEGEPLLSRWSSEWVFTTALDKVSVPVTWEPVNGAQGIICQPSFGWTAVGGTTAYEFELADNPEFIGATKVIVIINSWASDTKLACNTTYYWRVRALKDNLVISDWISGIFTTMVKPTSSVVVTSPSAAPEITLPTPPVVIPAQATPVWVWVIISLGTLLVISVVVLIIRTRRVL
ncbi:hypothetical protein ACFLUE_01615 [Chloroflexota bacterium]